MKFKTWTFLMIVSLICCCNNPPVFKKIFDEPDLAPPQLLEFQTNEKGLCLFFDENIIIEKNCEIIPEITIIDSQVIDKKLEIMLEKAIPGTEYQLLLIIKDNNGNSQNLMLSFYGFNPNLPQVLINEFTTKGSPTHPDLVEILIQKAGNIGGLCFYEGTKNIWRQRFIFPSVDLKEGDYLVLHTKPQGKPEEINETQNPKDSKGLDAGDRAYDFWLKQGKGLSSNNGVLTLYSSPEGDLIDAVIYSNRNAQSDTKYRGFGSRKFREQAEELARLEVWEYQGPVITPEDAVNSQYTTATRSIVRIPGHSDSNHKNDWMIVDTREASFGYENSDQAYEGP